MQAKCMIPCSPADPLSVSWSWHKRVFLSEKNARAVWWASSAVGTENCVLPALLLPLMPFSGFTFSLLFSPTKEQTSLSDFYFFSPKKVIAHQPLTTFYKGILHRSTEPRGDFLLLWVAEGQVGYSCTTSQVMSLLTHGDTGMGKIWEFSHFEVALRSLLSLDRDRTSMVRIWEFSLLEVAPQIPAPSGQGQDLREGLGGISGDFWLGIF